MSLKKKIIRISLFALWVCLCASVLVLLVAANDIKDHKSSRGIAIEILGAREIFFLNKTDILKIVTGERRPNPAFSAVTSFDLRKLETVLEKNVWVKDAELYFDNNLVLHINVMEKEPVARVFNSNGYSFYLDSSGSKMPLNDKMNVKLPVFTGFPSGSKLSKETDSMLTGQIKKLSGYIMDDKFWMAQIAQVDITPDKNFEMIPTVGNHLIQFGDGNNHENKFRRLFIFYKDVLGKVGLDTYSRISVQYNRQVIGTKKGTVTKIDSVQALKNIQKMIDEAKRISDDSVYVPAESITVPMPEKDSTVPIVRVDSGNEIRKKTMKDNNKIVKPAPANYKRVATERLVIKGKPIKKGSLEKTDDQQKPKAVMMKLAND